VLILILASVKTASYSLLTITLMSRSSASGAESMLTTLKGKGYTNFTEGASLETISEETNTVDLSTKE
jgi:hypothetical protein